MFYNTFEKKKQLTRIRKNNHDLTFCQNICQKNVPQKRKQKSTPQRRKKTNWPRIWGEPKSWIQCLFRFAFFLAFLGWLVRFCFGLLSILPFHFFMFLEFVTVNRCLSPRVGLQVVSLIHLAKVDTSFFVFLSLLYFFFVFCFLVFFSWSASLWIYIFFSFSPLLMEIQQ